MDPDDVTAVELAAAYAERWEYEISLREIETQMLEPGGGLRSKSPELLRQELWGLLLAHFAIRSLMAEAAASAGLDPDRLSFMRSISLVRRQVTDQAAFSPGRLERARETAIAEILERVNKGRRKRTYPRVIKKYSGRSFPVKQAGQTGQRHDPVLEIRYPLVALGTVISTV